MAQPREALVASNSFVKEIKILEIQNSGSINCTAMSLMIFAVSWNEENVLFFELSKGGGSPMVAEGGAFRLRNQDPVLPC